MSETPGMGEPPAPDAALAPDAAPGAQAAPGARATLRALFDAMVRRGDPLHTLPALLPEKPRGRVVLLGAGKAAARMAEAVESRWGPCTGLVVTRGGYTRPGLGVEVVEAGHPYPDASGSRAARRMMDIARGLGPGDTAVCLVSGGASSLLSLPPPGIGLDDIRSLTEALLSSGAPIEDVNVVRRHLCAAKGGRLALAAHPARVLSFVISDVPGDDLALVGSGPTVGHDSGPEDVRAILDRYEVAVPAGVGAHLAMATSHAAPNDPRLATTTNTLLVSPAQALAHVVARARRDGFHVTDLGAEVEGDAATVARTHADMALAIHSDPLRPTPHLILSGGELTVTVRGGGSGGPNAEYALALAIALNGHPGIHAMACDTDGVDGIADIAGAFVHPATLAAARRAGRVPENDLAANDAHSFHAAAGGSVETGPTYTNVNDFRAILIGGDPG